ncbi:MAG TPA: response regulator [Thermoanaerobaculia bacterium]|nr:response regulator [Thermoanaerobaculia bacterium]
MPTPAPSSTSLLVVVDDDNSVRRALRRNLTAAGYAVKTFATAGELLDGELPAGLAGAVIDVHLPDMNGVALMQRLQARHAGLPVVLITADADPQLRSRALRQGASALLNKPFDEEQLLAALGRALDGHGPPP